jgi:AraC-like DNA-binding protein
MLHVERHESPELAWEMASRDADPRLCGHVRNYTGYVERSAEPLCRREVPNSDITLILSPASQLLIPDTRAGSGAVARHTSFVAALHDRHALVEHSGFQEGIEVRLTPLGGHALFGLPMHELSNRVIELDELLGPGADELVGRLWDESGWERRFTLLDELIGARLQASASTSGELSWAWWRLRRTHGRTSVGGLARELGWSHRRLIARFREGIGLPPKVVARVLRFERVAHTLMGVPEPRLAEVAFDSGYYDQAHLNRDFREFAGTTPTEFLSARLPEGGGVTG